MLRRLRARLTAGGLPPVPEHNQWLLFLAVFFFFTIIGWISALASHRQTLTLGSACLTAALSGIIAVLYATVVTKRWWWMLLIALAIHLMGAPWIWNELGTRGIIGTVPSGIDPGPIRSAQMVMAVACLAIGQTLLVIFLNANARRSSRMRGEVEQAQRIHAAVVTPAHVRTPALEVIAKTFPSAQIGGDLIDVIESSAGVDIIVADVAGHGVGAGLVSGMIKSAVRMEVGEGRSTDLVSLARRLNAMLAELTRPEMFVTCACVRLARNGRETQVLLAGHPPVLVLRAGAGLAERVEGDALPLAIEPGWDGHVQCITLGTGDRMMIFTDGLNETAGKDGKQLGLDRLGEVFARACALPSLEASHDAILASVREFGAQLDDRSLVLVRVA